MCLILYVCVIKSLLCESRVSIEKESWKVPAMGAAGKRRSERGEAALLSSLLCQGAGAIAPEGKERKIRVYQGSVGKEKIVMRHPILVAATATMMGGVWRVGYLID